MNKKPRDMHDDAEKKGPPEALPEAVKAPARKVCRSVDELPAERRERVEQLLVDGASFEEVVETIEEEGQERISRNAVANFFRSNRELQQRRVRQMVARAEGLKAALENPESAEGQLAEAALTVGYLCLNRKAAELNLKDAELLRLRREHLSLQNRLGRLRARKDAQNLAIRRKRLELDEKKFELLGQRIRNLYREIQEEGKHKQLGQETLQKIREIYGLVNLPTIPVEELTR